MWTFIKTVMNFVLKYKIQIWLGLSVFVLLFVDGYRLQGFLSTIVAGVVLTNNTGNVLNFFVKYLTILVKKFFFIAVGGKGVSLALFANGALLMLVGMMSANPLIPAIGGVGIILSIIVAVGNAANKK